MQDKMTGYPSIDKPWLKYYSEEAINASLPTGSMYDYMYLCNKNRMNDVALNYFGKRITHNQLQENIDICAKALVANGVKAGDYVSLCLLAIPETVYLLYAVNKIGAVCNFLVLNATEQDLHKQIMICESRVIFTVDMVEEKILNAAKDSAVERVVSISVTQSMPKGLSIFMKLKKGRRKIYSKIVDWNKFVKSGVSAKLSFSKGKDEDSAVIEYTGGTTGESKGVVLDNKAGNALAFHYRNAETIFHFKQGELFLDILPPFLAYGLFLGIHMPLCVGTEIIISPDPSPQNFPKLICKYKPNHFTGGPMHIDNLLKCSATYKMDFSFLVTAAFGGDKVSDEWEERAATFLHERNAKYGIVNGYGMTETAGACCTTSHELKHMIPFVKNNIKIIDVENGRELQYGQEGEICVSGPTVMRGYYKNILATNEVIWEENGIRWLRTGDLGYVTEEGYFIISGRLKRLFWSKGANGAIYRVYPMQIESVICKYPKVHKCSVVGKPCGDKGFLPIAFIVLQDGFSEDGCVEHIQKLCQKELSESSWPHEYRIVKTLPTTSAGKVDYRLLEKEVRRD